MYLKPRPLSSIHIFDDETLRKDKAECKKCGECGAGRKALYLGGFYFDRILYLPYSACRRIYKQVAMSKGGFTGHGIFGSLTYVVAEYDDGKVRKCRVKHEEYADMLLAYIKEFCPSMQLHSAESQKRLDEAETEEKKKLKSDLSETARKSLTKIEKAKAVLEERPNVYTELSAASKAKRVNDIANPTYKWFALIIVIAGVLAAAWGVFLVVTHGTGGIGVYLILFGAAFVLLFAGANVLPLGRNNKASIDRRQENAVIAMRNLLAHEAHFPVPAQYAHPMTLRRMERIIREGRAETTEEAYETMKKELQAVNSSTTVSQTEYDEITAIKPMFLTHAYQDQELERKR